MINTQDLNLWATLPALSLALGSCVLFLVDAFIPKERKDITAWLSIAGLAVSLVLTIIGYNYKVTAFSGMFIADTFTALINVISIITAFTSILVAYNYLKRAKIERGEYYPLLLMTAAGAMFMGAAGDLMIVFVALELLSIPLYIMAGFGRPGPRSRERTVREFFLGGFLVG